MGTGFFKQLAQTGMRLISVSGTAQIRHWSGKMNAKTLEANFVTGDGMANVRGTLSLLLLKTHPQ
jgi:hypothetical protein